jgi:Arc/MetJ-type ribon-helix-helix transcriptional regulator
MKLSVSLTADDVAFVDEYAAQAGVASRSAVIHQAIDLLRSAGLENAYAAAWEEWDASEDAGLWDATAADGATAASW